MNYNTNITGTKEWADKTINIASGCENNCHYCYAKHMAIRFKRKTNENWKLPEINQKKVNNSYQNTDKTIMFPSSHDITPSNLNESIHFISTHMKANNKLLIVSKPRFECIKAICDEFMDYRENILFRFTIGSANNEVLRFWEPFAPDFNERLESLIYAYNLGYKTSISCEPMLDNDIDSVIRQVKDYVTDSIWLGKVNRLKVILRQSGVTEEIIFQKADELNEQQNDNNIFQLYERYQNDPLIKWKESIKKVVGIPLNTQTGLDN